MMLQVLEGLLLVVLVYRFSELKVPAFTLWVLGIFAKDCIFPVTAIPPWVHLVILVLVAASAAEYVWRDNMWRLLSGLFTACFVLLALHELQTYRLLDRPLQIRPFAFAAIAGWLLISWLRQMDVYGAIWIGHLSAHVIGSTWPYDSKEGWLAIQQAQKLEATIAMVLWCGWAVFAQPSRRS